MRSILTYIILLNTFFSLGQQVSLVSQNSMKADRLIGFDNFGTYYEIKDAEFFKTSSTGELNYSNVQLGKISSANVFNPLKISLFYENFNTVIVLDNRLAEITLVKFNNLSPFRLVTYVSAGYDNTIWIYDQNTQQMELFDFINLKTRVTTLPISGELIELTSNFNFCYVLTTEDILVYNYFGNLISKQPHQGFTAFEENNGVLYLKKENKIYTKDPNSYEYNALELPELLINQFFVTDETLYIYDGVILHQFQLKAN
ncbi:MAG: hypothetical protein HKO90_07095 [Flavobacteriaceae bacterium]|nr:hypothetical protein [Bacteroidia bacterium]NNK88032.1 hypothetical protein [Flavobacteriaceae bacterium]